MKPICLLTNFYEAEVLLKQGHYLWYKDDSLIKVNISSSNSVFCSIALSMPDFKRLSFKLNKNSFVNLDFFAPTYKILKKHKEDKDWISYEEEYRKILRQNQDDIKDWSNSLMDDRVYILCCWESLDIEAHCHRQILNDAFSSKSFFLNRFITILSPGLSKFSPEFNKTIKSNNKQVIDDQMQDIVDYALPLNGLTVNNNNDLDVF